jgi:quinol monooxygenase YgiN
MTFRSDAVETFKKFFDERKDRIRGFEGCTYLELWQDKTTINIFFTYSHWNDETSLSHYRNSAFFKDTWLQARQLFAAKAEAWSINQLVIMP